MRRLLILLILLPAVGLSGEPKIEGFFVGEPAPSFNVPTLDGRYVALADLGGQCVVVNWWSTTCAPCIMEMPLLDELVDKYAGERVYFLAVADNSSEEITRFFDRHSFDYVKATTDSVFLGHLGKSFPRHLVIDSTGVVQTHLIGMYDDIHHRLDLEIARCGDYRPWGSVEWLVRGLF